MRKQKRAIHLETTDMVKSKIPNQKILRMALILGMISKDQYTCLSAIGDSKEIDELARELAAMGLDLLVDVLKQLARQELIEIT